MAELRVALSGTFAGVVGTLLGYPLDVIKTKMQINTSKYPSMLKACNTIIHEEGILRGFYKGVGSPLLSLTFLNTMNFTNYYYCRNILGVTDKTVANHFDFRTFVAGGFTGIFAAFVSTPFELVKTQMQLSKQLGHEYSNSLEAAIIISRRYGFKSLYTGHTINTAREITFLGTYFTVYEHCKSYVSLYVPKQVSIPLAGGLSGAIGWLVSYPMDSIKSNIQGLQLSTLGDRNRHILPVAMNILKKHGLSGLYKGVAPSVLRAFVVSSTRFSAYEFAYWFLS